MHHTTRTLLLLCLGLCTLTCSESGDTGHRFAIHNEGGIPTAVTAGGPRFDGEVFTYEPVFELSQNPESPEELLWNPGTMLMDGAGWIYVDDAGNHRIAVFDSNGDFVRSMGREGEGPGEFRVLDLNSVRNGRLSVFDAQLQRTTVYSTEGALLEVFHPHLIIAGPRVNGLEVTEDGHRFITVFQESTEGEIDSRFTYIGIRGLVTSTDGDTLADISTPMVAWGYTYTSASGGQGMGSMEFTAWPQVTYVWQRGILVTTGEEPELSWYDLQGNRKSRIRLELEPQRVTQEEISAVKAARRASYERSGRDPARYERSLGAMRFPEYKAFWSGVQVDDTGWLWLGIPEASTQIIESGQSFRVLTPDGEYIGNSRWPVRWGTVSRGHFLAVVENEDTGAQKQVIHRIVPAQQGLFYP